MISREKLNEQLDKLNFRHDGWGRSEVAELCNILMPDEEIEELVNGYYEAGFALLVATKERVLLVDKKPLNYLTVEDLRFDMISEFDYSHRVIGAHVTISSGSKNLKFTSLNQQRLRQLLTYVQTRITEIKKTQHTQQEAQQQHLEEMNEQLRQYLISARQESVQARAELSQHAFAASQPYFSPNDGYQLPSPQPAPTEVLRDRSAFERAAAASVGAAVPVEYRSAPSVIRKVIVTPQQVGLSALRRIASTTTGYRPARATTETRAA